MNLKILFTFAAATFAIQAFGCNNTTKFFETSSLHAWFPISKQMRDYSFIVPTTKNELDALHDIYVKSGRTKCSISDIWFGVGRKVFINALEGIMTADKRKIANDVASYGKFIKLAKTVNYGDRFCDTLFVQPQTISRSISDPLFTLSSTISCDLYAAKFNTTVENIKRNGGYMAIKMYDVVLKNYKLYDDLLSHYEKVTSSYYTPEVNIEDLVKSLLGTK